MIQNFPPRGRCFTVNGTAQRFDQDSTILSWPSGDGSTFKLINSDTVDFGVAISMRATCIE
ncbi:MAG: hypothetical protein AAF939_17370 [Planctomycetota bacterium]